ncbi:MAG: CsgG/HfaB family protein [Elusimicrobiota bacterium]|nr:CsgG/HfaB family protein [Elusimicrobiota bacterium]
MKRIIMLLLTSAFLAGCGAPVKTVIRGEVDPSGRVAVMPFSGKDEDTGLSLSEAFTTYLMDAGFDVIERAQLEKVLGEQKVSLSGAMDAQAMVQAGKLAGVGVIVTGSYRVRREETRTVTHQPMQPRPMPQGPGKRMQPGRPGPGKGPGQGPGGPAQTRIDSNTVFSGLTVKFVDVNSGRVLLSCSTQKDYDADSVNKALSAMAVSIRKKLKK